MNLLICNYDRVLINVEMDINNIDDILFRLK